MDYTFDISLYGHLTKDIVINNFSQTFTLGAMANVWECLTSINPTLSINLEPVALGSALILVDEKNSSRVSKPNMNQILKPDINTDITSKWSHILYLNQLPNLGFIKKLPNISKYISADISSGGKIPYEYLKYIDFLFISEEDLNIPLKELCNKTKGWVILHYPNGSTTSNGKKTIKCNNKIIKNLNVLGAGDIFASNFINQMLKTTSIKESLELSHALTYKALKQKNDEKKV